VDTLRRVRRRDGLGDARGNQESGDEMSRFNSWWIRGWALVIALALVYEGAAFVSETWGDATLPTLSTLIVTLIPLPILDALTVIVCVVLLWHWKSLHDKLN
jgi:hypothetical protein